MNTLPTYQPGRSLTWFARLLGLLSGLLVVATAVALPLGALVASGRGTLTMETRLNPPYSVGLDPPTDNIFADGGRRIDVYEDGVGAYLNFPIGEEDASFQQAPTVRAPVRVARDDRDTRLLTLSLVLAWLGLAWVGLQSLRRVVATAVAGEPFEVRNVRRLRWLAATVLVYPVLSQVFIHLVDRTLDVPAQVTPILTGTPWWVLVVVGMGLLALAEVFRVGAELHELEQSTV